MVCKEDGQITPLGKTSIPAVNICKSPKFSNKYMTSNGKFFNFPLLLNRNSRTDDSPPCKKLCSIVSRFSFPDMITYSKESPGKLFDSIMVKSGLSLIISAEKL